MQNLLIVYGVPTLIGIVISIVVTIRKRGKTVDLGIKAGKFISKWIKKLLAGIARKIPVINNSADKIEDAIENTVSDICDGVKIGMRLDNMPNYDKGLIQHKLKKACKIAGNDSRRIEDLKNIML